MAGLDAGIIQNLENQVNQLKPGTEIVIKLTQKELWKNIKWKLKNGAVYEYDPKTNKVIVYKPKKENLKCAEWVMFEDGDNIQEAIDVCSDEIEQSIQDSINDLNKQLDEKIKELRKELRSKQIKAERAERVNKMYPTRIFRYFSLEFDNLWKQWEYDEILKYAENLYKAVKNWKVDTKVYNIWLPLYKNSILPTLEKSPDFKWKKRLIEIIKYIIEHTKTKDYNLA